MQDAPDVYYNQASDSVFVSKDGNDIVFSASKIQEVITALLECHSQYFDELLRRSDHAKD